MATWWEALTGSLEQKRRYRRDRARIDALPEPYAASAKAMHRYIVRTGGVIDGEILVELFSGLADLWERAAADGAPVSAIVGEDPAEFAEEFVQAYAGGSRWTDPERARLRRAIDDAVEAPGGA